MMHDEIALSMGKIFSLKHIILSTFDTTPLKLSINQTQDRILMLCWRHENATMQFLSRAGGLEKGSLTTVIDTLEEKHLVLREKNEEDRRSFIVRATPEGIKVAQQIDALMRIHLDSIIKKLPKKEQKEFKESIVTLARIISHLDCKE